MSRRILSFPETKACVRKAPERIIDPVRSTVLLLPKSFHSQGHGAEDKEQSGGLKAKYGRRER
jgi:hypothetical protein